MNRLARQGARWVIPERAYSEGQGGKSASSPLTRIAPTFDVLGAIFDVLPVATTEADVAGTAAIRLLRRLEVDRETGQEIALLGIRATLLPCDVDGSGSAATGVAAADAIGWGDATGTTAAIIVGKNLPLVEGVWNRRPIALPGILANATAANNSDLLANFLAVFQFPPGKFTDTVPNKSEPIMPYGGSHVHRFGAGDRLDVAIVIRGSQVVGQAAAAYVVGNVDVRMTVGLVNDRAQFYE